MNRDTFFKGDQNNAGSQKSDINQRERDPEREAALVTGTVNKSAAPSKDVEGYVGFASLPNQIYRKSVKNGFEFTMMVVGEF